MINLRVILQTDFYDKVKSVVKKVQCSGRNLQTLPFFVFCNIHMNHFTSHSQRWSHGAYKL